MSRVPLQFTAGLTFTLTERTPGYMAPAWSLKLLLRGPSVVDLTSTPGDLGEHVITAPATATVDWNPGRYSYSLRLTDGTQVLERESGSFEVLAALEKLTEGADIRHPFEVTLDSIEAVLARRATQDQARYRITTNNGMERELWLVPFPELLQLRAQYRAAVRQLRAKQRGRTNFGQVIRPALK